MLARMDRLDAGFLKNRVALLSNLSEERLRALADGSQIVSLPPGEVVIHAGDEMHFLGVVLEGKIAAAVPAGNGAPHSLGELGPGETFGEMALLSGDPALADLRAASCSSATCASGWIRALPSPCTSIPMKRTRPICAMAPAALSPEFSMRIERFFHHMGPTREA